MMSGGLGFLLKIPGIYRPDAYMISTGYDGIIAPGTGGTPFEICATYVFAIIYLGPLVGMVYAHIEGSKVAKRASIMMPLVYHISSTMGVLFVFPHALNPHVASLTMAAGMHVFYAVLFALLWYSADDSKLSKTSIANKSQ
jgi:heme A synthase